MKQDIKRISPAEAEQFLSRDEDLLGYPVEYFTLTPSAQQGWEDVTYYTGRRRASVDTTTDGKYWIYVLSNPAMPGLLKIGYTKNSPQERAYQISAATGVAMPFVVEWSFKCHEGEFLEQEIHSKLDPYRVSGNREFFRIELDSAIETVKELGKKYTLQTKTEQ